VGFDAQTCEKSHLTP